MMIEKEHAEPSSSRSRLCIHKRVPYELREAMINVSNILYDEEWQPGASTACIFTSMVLTGSLRMLGFDARPVAVAVEGRLPEGRFGVGHPSYALVRENAWKGHMVCMVGNILVDATIGQIRRWGVIAPNLIAAPCAEAWRPELQLALPSNCNLAWTERGANQAWRREPDARADVWGPATIRLIERLPSPIACLATAE